MSDRRAIAFLAACIALGLAVRFIGLQSYVPYMLGAAVIAGFVYLGFKIDDLRSDLKYVQRDVAELQEARRRDLEDTLR